MSKKSKDNKIMVKAPPINRACTYAEVVSGTNKNDKNTPNTWIAWDRQSH